jgi:hypothetical protein
MDLPRSLSSNFPKKSFSGTNNAKILQKIPSTRDLPGTGKRNYGNHYVPTGILIVVKEND